MKKNKFVKSLMIMVLLLFSTVALTACSGKKDKYPLGSITDEVYVSAGDHQITKKELYNEMRYDGLSILQTLIDEKVFNKYYQKIDYTNEDQRKVLEETINTAVYGIDDVEQLTDFYKLDADNKNLDKLTKVKTYVDSLLIVGKILPNQKDALVQELFDNTTFEGYSNTLLDLYKQKIALRLFAKEKLDEELEDEKSKQYIKDEDVVNYYKNNRKGQYDVSAFWTEFLNLNEQRAVFKQLSVKISSSGKWFLVPDIRITDITDPNYVDIDHVDNKHIKDILTNKKIKYVDELNQRVEISKDNFESYYDSYTFSEDRSGAPDLPFAKEKVLEYIIKAHNLVHAEQLKVAEGVVVKAADDTPVNVDYKYEDFKNTQLRNHIYTALKLPTEDEPNNVQYSQRPNSFGEYVYLVYKFNDASAGEEGILNEDEDAFLEGNDDLIAELKAEMVDNKLTESYISDKVNEHNKDEKLNIYDPILRALYSRDNEYKGATKMKDKDTLAEIGDVVVTVDEFFKEAEKTFGIATAQDLLTAKILKVNYYDKIDKETHEANETSIKNMLTAFSQNQYATSNFPAEMGREQFLLLAFRSKSVDEAKEKAFEIPKMNELFEKDLEAHYGEEGNTIYDKFQRLSQKQYENYWLLRASHILIYLDLNLDGTPDKPNELEPEVLAAAQALLPKFVKAIFKRIGDETTEAKGIERLIADYNQSTRLTSDDPYSKESVWAEFKRFGFKLKQESLGDITNSSNFLQSQSRLDEVFYTRAKAIYGIVKDYSTAQFPFLDFFNGDPSFEQADPADTLANIEKIQTNFGWHLIMANSVDTKMPSAKLDVKVDDTHLSKELDKDGNKLDGSNPLDVVSATQIEIYLKELASEYNVQIRVSNAIQKQFGQVKAKYESSQMKNEIIYNLLVKEGIKFADAAATEKFNAIREINKLQMFNYQMGTSAAFDALWGTWFDEFK
ncbi:MAG: hypothetical protein ACOX56_00165 [Acholeplasmataceae bacterium]